jgi:hypothetical protein
MVAQLNTGFFSSTVPATRLASREILIEQNFKKRTGPALCVLCGVNSETTRKSTSGAACTHVQGQGYSS